MKTLNITIDGEPQAQKRWRMSKSGHAYDPSAKDKQEFAAKVKEQIGKQNFCKEEVYLTLDFCMARPKKYFSAGETHTHKPDLDNLIKFVLDSCNGILWEDDKIIGLIDATKRYSNHAATAITIEGK